ncbi:MAG: hypothetical protein OEN50_08940, partial [Deltaproteobacteria bacterium]|nr:hypothetical protein [Deltaproteobacteria bacterium]
MKRLPVIVFALIVSLTLATKSGFAAPDEYDESQSNPLRIAAYLLHPIGVITEWVIVRPFHYMVSANEQQEKIFGHRPHPPLLSETRPDYGYGMSKRVPLKHAQAASRQVAAAPMGEQVRIVEVPVEKVVTREVVKEVEVERVIFPGV